MEVVCSSCGKTIVIPEEKIPSNITKFALKCPYCKNKIVVERKKTEEIEKNAHITDFYTIEPDNFPPGAKTAFLYVFDKDWKKGIISFLEKKGFYISEAEEEDIGVQKLRINPYNVIFIEEKNATPLLNEISSWPGNQRRETNVILIGDRAKSFDLMTAFISGVNCYLSIHDKENMEDVLEEAMARYKSFIEMWETARSLVEE